MTHVQCEQCRSWQWHQKPKLLQVLEGWAPVLEQVAVVIQMPWHQPWWRRQQQQQRQLELGWAASVERWRTSGQDPSPQGWGRSLGGETNKDKVQVPSVLNNSYKVCLGQRHVNKSENMSMSIPPLRHSLTHTHTHMYVQVHMYTNTHTHACGSSHVHTHTHMHAHMCTHTQASTKYTHTH